MFRYKNAFDGKLKKRLPDAQKAEATVRTKILNQFTQFGMPEFEWS